MTLYSHASSNSQIRAIRFWLIGVAALYGAACFSPAISFEDWGITYGYQCLIMWLHPSWLANVFFLIGIGVAVSGRHKESIPFALISLILAVPLISMGSGGSGDRLLVGAWLWLAAFVAFLVGAIVFRSASIDQTDDHLAGAIHS